jgi:hypothetical protein
MPLSVSVSRILSLRLNRMAYCRHWQFFIVCENTNFWYWCLLMMELGKRSEKDLWKEGLEGKERKRGGWKGKIGERPTWQIADRPQNSELSQAWKKISGSWLQG